MLKFDQVTKKYKIREGGVVRPQFRWIKALDSIDLTVGTGERLGILGPNGSGKTTMCKIAAGMIKPTSGKVTLDGVDVTANVRTATKSIGTVIGQTLVYHRLTGRDYLRFFAKIYGVKDHERRIAELADFMQLRKWLPSYIESYSLGMKMKISLARALLHDPPFLILDEFTIGLDSDTAREIRTLVKDSRKTVLLTSHNAADIETICGSVAFMASGRIVKVDTVGSLLSGRARRVHVSITLSNPQGLSNEVSAIPGAGSEQVGVDRVRVSLDRDSLPELMKILSRYQVRGVETERSTLEEVYTESTGRLLAPKPHADGLTSP